MMTARDILTLAERIYADFPEYYHYFGEKEFTSTTSQATATRCSQGHRRRRPEDRSPHHIRVRPRRLGQAIAALHGRARHGKHAEPPDEATKLIEWAFQSFQNVKLAKAGDQLEQAPVWYGKADAVALTVAKDLVVTLPKGNQEEIQAKAVFQGPVQAPVAAGQPLGKLVITSSSGTTEVPLVAAAAVDRVGIFGHIIATLKYLVSLQG
jgi:D-alanyl-D-alanine carboxypeptidase (penicillin-binding protein 5/6)